jgi:hypothetical protein
MLYSDTDEVLLDAQRPVLLTGIEELATRGDLLDRALILSLPPIPERERRTEAEFWAEFEEERPRILGALLDAVSTALAREQDVQLERLPRMADFAVWVSAAEPALGWPAGAFLDAYGENRTEAHELTLEASPIARPVRDVAENGGFLGTATDLIAVLNERVNEDATKAKTWPRNGRALSGALRRIAPHLRAVGVAVEFDQRHGSSKRAIRIGTEICDPTDFCAQDEGASDAEPGAKAAAGASLRLYSGEEA